MLPYYDRDGCTIYLGDALETLDALRPTLAGTVDAVVMDPPYASGARQEAQKRASGSMLAGESWEKRPIFGDEMTTEGFVWMMRQTARRIRPLVTTGGSLLSFIDWRQWGNLLAAVETAGWRVNKMIVWDKLYAALGNGFRSQHELILFASIGTAAIHDKCAGDVIEAAEEPLDGEVWKQKREPNTVHPSMKPIALMQRLIKTCAPVGGLVVDPFMGSGSTLLAAKMLGVRAIGVEAIEEFAEAAALRLDGYTAQGAGEEAAWQGGLAL